MSTRDADTGEVSSPLRPYVVCATDPLQYISESHRSFFQDDASVTSVLSIPFSDAPIGEIALANIPRGKSISTLLTFSSATQTVMNALRKDTTTFETLVTDPLDFLNPTRRLSRSTTSLDEKVRECLNDARMRLTPPSISSEDEDNEEDAKKEEVKQKEDKELEVKKVSKKREVESEVEYFDSKSGLWRMLGSYDEFVVTRPGFNAFTEAAPHWSEREPPSWDKLEESRQKCQDWLNKWDPPLKK